MNLAISTQKTDFISELESHVKTMYRAVALYPESAFHFEMGRVLAERLGYDPRDLDRIPAASIESFAGVGYHFDLADLQKNQFVVDLGSGSGMDTFVAANKVGYSGCIIGIDMTDEQRNKANYLRDTGGFCNVSYKKAYIDDTGLPGGLYHAVISNGVVNLAADKTAVFNEAYRLLRKGGKLALSDIVTETALPEGVTCDATLWAACIGGAMQQDDYINTAEQAGFRVIAVRGNPEYHFISEGATWATDTYGVKSISLLAVKH
ncbi:MAG TPA: methyltransferase domain-containing protein [Gammaproteobacteria bacterium]